MIKNVRYSRLDLPKSKTLSEQSLSIINKNHPDNALLSPMLPAVRAALQKAESALGSTQKEALTEDVTQADANRDDNIAGLKGHVKSGIKRHSNIPYQEACKRLYAIFEKYGPLERKSYPNQTSLLDALIADLKTPQATADLATANATEWFGELGADADHFKGLYLQRNEDIAGRDVPTDTEAFRAVKIATENLFTVIDAHYLGGQIEGLEATIKVINETIDRVGGDNFFLKRNICAR